MTRFPVLAALSGAALLAMLGAAHAGQEAPIEAALIACGIPAERVTSLTDAAVGIVEATITGEEPLPEEVLACAVRVEAEGGYGTHLRFDSVDMAGRSVELGEELEPLRVHHEGLRQLEMLGLREGLPLHDPASEPLAAFAARLETHCSVARPGTLIASADGRYLTLSAAALADPPAPEEFECLSAAAAGSNLWEQGIFFGFVADDAASAAE